MSDLDGDFMETTSNWAPPSSPSPRAILAMLNQSDNGLNPISEIFTQTNLSTDQEHDQSEQKSSDLGERLAARTGFDLPKLDTDNMSSSFAAFLRTSSVPSPGFSPSTLLQSPNILPNSSHIVPPSQNTNNGPPQIAETAGEGHTTTMISNNDLPHQPLQVDLPPQEGCDDISTNETVYIPTHESLVDPTACGPLVALLESEVIEDEDIINFISLESEDGHENEEDNEDNKEEDDDDIADELVNIEEEEDDENEEDQDIADKLVNVVEPLPQKRRKYEVASNMVGAKRTSKQQRVILQMESEEDLPDDGFRWRKYGRKVVKWNPNPRSYYKCTYEGCNVKKHVERGADNVKLVVTTYDGIHRHAAPTRRGRYTGPRNRSKEPIAHQDDRTARLYEPPSSDIIKPFTSSLEPQFDMTKLTPSLEPQFDMTKLYMTGLSKLPSLPVNQNQNSGFMYRNDEPKTNVIPDDTEVYNGIINQLFVNFGLNL